MHVLEETTFTSPCIIYVFIYLIFLTAFLMELIDFFFNF